MNGNLPEILELAFVVVVVRAIGSRLFVGPCSLRRVLCAIIMCCVLKAEREGGLSIFSLFGLNIVLYQTWLCGFFVPLILFILSLSYSLLLLSLPSSYMTASLTRSHS